MAFPRAFSIGCKVTGTYSLHVSSTEYVCSEGRSAGAQGISVFEWLVATALYGDQGAIDLKA